MAETDIMGATIREYVYLNGQPLALISNGGIHTIHTDHLGTPQVLTDANENVVWEADYEPFGEATITTEAVTNNLRFPGQYFDQETGLHYNMRRYYSSELGRYLTSDPIGLDGGLNTYNYVLQNPMNRVDRVGLKSYLFQVRVGGGVSIPGIVGSVFNLSVIDPIRGRTCNYTVSCIGVGWSYRGSPDVSFIGPPVKWDDGKECSECTQFEGNGYGGSVAFQFGPVGYTPVEWLKVPNGPRLDLKGYSPAQFNIGGGTYACYFDL